MCDLDRFPKASYTHTHTHMLTRTHPTHHTHTHTHMIYYIYIYIYTYTYTYIYIYTYTYTYIYIHIYTHAGVLSLIYTHNDQRHTAPEGKCIYIRQSKRICVITIMLHFRHSKIHPNLQATAQPAYIVIHTDCDYGSLF